MTMLPKNIMGFVKMEVTAGLLYQIATHVRNKMASECMQPVVRDDNLVGLLTFTHKHTLHTHTHAHTLCSTLRLARGICLLFLCGAVMNKHELQSLFLHQKQRNRKVQLLRQVLCFLMFGGCCVCRYFYYCCCFCRVGAADECK